MTKKTAEQIHHNMSKIRGSDTKIELILRKALYHKGYRYYKNYPHLEGTPDIVLKKYNIVIFCDGDFWHGKDFDKIEKSLENSDHKDYWIQKIKQNMERDRKVNEILAQKGYIVLRFSETEIMKKLDEVLSTIDKIAKQ